jgi:hypothetical protein
MKACAELVHGGWWDGRPKLLLHRDAGAPLLVELSVPAKGERVMTEQMNGSAVPLDVEAQIEREIDERLAAEVAARRAALRLEITSRLQRERDKRHYDAIAERGREVEREQLAFDTDPQREVEREASRKIDRERREAADERWRRGEAARVAQECAPGKPRPRKLDSEGFEIR